jgi:hypothetical protein
MRLSPWAQEFNLLVQHWGKGGSGYSYQIKDVFTTREGKWCSFSLSPYTNCDYQIGTPPSWALPYSGFEGDTAPNSMFGAVLNTDGQLIIASPFRYKRRSDDQALHEPVIITGEHGWAIHPLEAIDSYSWRPKEEGGRDEPGPWCYGPAFSGEVEVICGVGMPDGMQISTFVVWQKVPVVSPAEYSPESVMMYLPIVTG